MDKNGRPTAQLFALGEAADIRDVTLKLQTSTVIDDEDQSPIGGQNCIYCLSLLVDMEDPRELSCKHVFCLECIRGALKGTIMSLNCPACGVVTKLDGDPVLLPKVALNNDKPAEQELSLAAEAIQVVKCTLNCPDKADAVSFCTNCKEAMCVKHEEGHDLLFGLNHDKVSIKTYLCSRSKFRKSLCEIHPTMELVVACEICSHPFCKQCDCDKECQGYPSASVKPGSAGGGLFGGSALPQAVAIGGLFSPTAAVKPSANALFMGTTRRRSIGGTISSQVAAVGGSLGSTVTAKPYTNAIGSTGGLFGGTALQPAAPVGGLFGSTAAAKSSTSAFGAGGGFFVGTASPQAAAGRGLFGSTAAAAKPSTSAFGMGTAGGLFGGTDLQPAAPVGGLVGSTAAAKPSTSAFGSTGGGILGCAASPKAAAGGGLFGSTAAAAKPSTNAFGMSSAGGGLFGGTASPQAAAGGGLFGSTAASAKPSTSAFGMGTAGGLFGGTDLQPAVTVGGLFGSTAPAETSTNEFGSTGGGLFGGSASPGLFGSTAAAAKLSTSAFGMGGLYGSEAETIAAAVTTGTISVKFAPVDGRDTEMKSGKTQKTKTKHYCITGMKEYESKSVEELRWEDYSSITSLRPKTKMKLGLNLQKKKEEKLNHDSDGKLQHKFVPLEKHEKAIREHLDQRLATLVTKQIEIWDKEKEICRHVARVEEFGAYAIEDVDILVEEQVNKLRANAEVYKKRIKAENDGKVKSANVALRRMGQMNEDIQAKESRITHSLRSADMSELMAFYRERTRNQHDFQQPLPFYHMCKMIASGYSTDKGQFYTKGYQPSKLISSASGFNIQGDVLSVCWLGPTKFVVGLPKAIQIFNISGEKTKECDLDVLLLRDLVVVQNQEIATLEEDSNGETSIKIRSSDLACVRLTTKLDSGPFASNPDRLYATATRLILSRTEKSNLQVFSTESDLSRCEDVNVRTIPLAIAPLSETHMLTMALLEEKKVAVLGVDSKQLTLKSITGLLSASTTLDTQEILISKSNGMESWSQIQSFFAPANGHLPFKRHIDNFTKTGRSPSTTPKLCAFSKHKDENGFFYLVNLLSRDIKVLNEQGVVTTLHHPDLSQVEEVTGIAVSENKLILGCGKQGTKVFTLR